MINIIINNNNRKEVFFLLELATVVKIIINE